MDGHLVIRNVKLKIKKENKWFFAKGQNMHSLYLLMLCIFLKSFHSHLSSALDFGVQKYCNFCQLNRQITSRNIIIWLVFFCTMGIFLFQKCAEICHKTVILTRKIHKSTKYSNIRLIEFETLYLFVCILDLYLEHYICVPYVKYDFFFFKGNALTWRCLFT